MSDTSEYRELFVQEANEHIEKLNENLLKLEKDPSIQECLEASFRSSHTVKGIAASMGYETISHLCHAIEDVFNKLKNKETKLTKDVATILFECLDNLEEMIDDENKTVDIKPLIQKLEEASESKQPESTQPESTQPESTQPESTQPDEKQIGSKHQKIDSIRVKSEDLDSLVNLVGELTIVKMRFDATLRDNPSEHIQNSLRDLNSLISQLQSKTMSIRLMPLEEVFARFPRVVRDLGRVVNKDVEMEMNVQGIELDRTVIDGIREPLIHIFRNSVDHGIETPSEREKIGKSKTGIVKLSSFRVGEKVLIKVEDDGGGINFKAIKSKAIKKGMITEEKAANMSDEEVIELLGTSGLSSTDKVTELSGRGVGFDVVRSQIESVGGQVNVESKEGNGTSITMTLPMSLAIISGLLISDSNSKYVLPISSVSSMTNIAKTDVKIVGTKEMITYRGKVLPLLRLSNILNSESNKPIQSDDEMIVAIINKTDNPFALVIAGFERKQEFVIKQLDSSSNTALFPYATILSSGEVALILDPSTITP